MRPFDRKPALRWVTPLAFVLVVGGTGGLVAATATADPRLPSRTAAELLVALQEAEVDSLSGTVVQRSDLGIPEIPGVGGSHDASLTSLISGTHTLQVWYSGPDKARLAVQGTFDESDVIWNGSDLWTWSYRDKTATHRTVSGHPADKSKQQRHPEMPRTPQEAADHVLKSIEPTTEVRTDGTAKVAGRAAYELILEPKDTDSLIRQVRIAIDGAKYIPLRVEFFAAGAKPAFEVAYTMVDFARPDDAQFAFNPPPGTQVTEVAPGTDPVQGHDRADPKPSPSEQPQVVGSGWSAVIVSKVPVASAENATGDLAAILNALPRASGGWGSGRVLNGTAFSAVLTDDGRLAVGSVRPELLFEALAS